MLLTKGRMPELQSLSIFLYFLIWIIWIGVVVPSFLLVGRSILTFHFESSEMFSGVSHSHLRWNIVSKLQSHSQSKRSRAICIKFMDKWMIRQAPIPPEGTGPTARPCPQSQEPRTVRDCLWRGWCLCPSDTCLHWHVDNNNFIIQRDLEEEGKPMRRKPTRGPTQTRGRMNMPAASTSRPGMVPTRSCRGIMRSCHWRGFTFTPASFKSSILGKLMIGRGCVPFQLMFTCVGSHL